MKLVLFGFIPGVGNFAVVRGTYSNSNAIAEYDTLVDGRRQRW